MLIIVTGNDIAELLQLNTNDASFSVDSGATVKAAIVSYDQSTLIAGPFTMLSGDDGADWPNSLMSLIVDKSLTSGLTVGKVQLEVSVDDSDKFSWFFDAEIKKGNIT